MDLRSLDFGYDVSPTARRMRRELRETRHRQRMVDRKTITMAAKRQMSQELISCHDCGNGVSFSARACPHCGSTEPSGPYQFSRKEARRHRIEERNDRRLILMTAGLAMVGAFYGLETSSSALGAIITVPLYGFVGAAIGAPLAFAINISRSWR